MHQSQRFCKSDDEIDKRGSSENNTPQVKRGAFWNRFVEEPWTVILPKDERRAYEVLACLAYMEPD